MNYFKKIEILEQEQLLNCITGVLSVIAFVRHAVLSNLYQDQSIMINPGLNYPQEALFHGFCAFGSMLTLILCAIFNNQIQEKLEKHRGKD